MTPIDLELLQADLPPLRSVHLPGSDSTVAYREAGQGDAAPIVFLHGIGGTSASYRAQFVALGRARRAIAWDAPGYGKSTALPQSEPSVSHYSARLLEFTSALGLAVFHLAATSWGTLIAADFAARHPERVRTLTLSGASIGTPPTAGEDRARMLQARLQRDAEGLMGRAPEKLVADDAPPAVIKILAEHRRAMRPDGYEQATRMLLATNAETIYKDITSPTLFAIGDADKVCPPEAHAWKLHRRVGGSKVAVFEGRGHILELEAPHQFNTLLEAFMAEAG